MARADRRCPRPATARARVRTPPTEVNTPGIEVPGVFASAGSVLTPAPAAARGADRIASADRRFSVSPPFAPLLRL